MLGHRKRRQFKQTDAFTRGRVIGLKRAGWSIRQIAADTHLGASTVHRLWRGWLEQGNVAIYRNAGATRVTSARVDRRILRQAVAAPQATCTAILQHVQDTLDRSISTRTISRRLVANGLHSCRPLRRLPLTPPNRRQHESRFCLSSDSRRVRVWRRRGERSNPAAIVERPTVRQRGIMVWGAIAYDSRSPLLRIQGTMTAQRYVDDVLRPVTLPYLQGVPNAFYQQDNARPHTARIIQQALQDVQMLPWPPYSPDLSPIEHVWDIIERRLRALPQPRSEDELWQMVEREWRAIPQDAIRTLIDSLPRRVAACIAVRVYSDHALSKSQCYRWFKKFQSGDFELDNEPHGKPPQKFEDAELQALLDEDSTQMQEKLAKQLQVSQGAVSLRLNSLGMTQKLSRWVPHENGSTSAILRAKSRGACPDNFQNRRLGPIASEKKAMLCIWWDQTGVVYFELLKPGKMVNTSRYEQQMHSLREALNEKRPEWREKHNNLILQHDNAPAHNATVVKNTIKDLGWGLLPPPAVITRLSTVGLPPFYIFRTRPKKTGIFELRHTPKMTC
ncbi:hypothetical protein LAZ67_8002914 [Cordylochernes scorpioides]|uniref:Transposase n=1 Tax=Cordylochernes scorpioides TaxID=51811 RepID=A0ABY6KT75_9ARAC|nr:hypothetical protein LAZ67_8002914 [Cordylochernes scorpioides]